MREIGAGDVLVVVRLDRLARSVSHLLDVIERLEESGAHFRSLRDPIDTSTPQGMFSLQVLGAVAQLERALISERTKAGIKAAQARGKLPGNPGLGEGAAAIPRPPRRETESSRRRHRLHGPLAADGPADAAPVPLGGRRSRSESGPERTGPSSGCAAPCAGRPRAPADAKLIERTPRRPPEDRLMMLVAGIAMADPDMPLRAIGAQLEAMRERTPRGGRQWAASSVKHLLDQAGKLGLAPSTGDGLIAAGHLTEQR